MDANGYTRRQKHIVAKIGNLNPNDWVLIREDDSYLIILSKENGTVKRILKEKK